jgi:CheY-like chemotaxis protein
MAPSPWKPLGNSGSADWIKFSVSDTGIGMAPEQMEKLFQPFVQGDASTSRKFGGTGLGMTITHRFCEMMGGEITAASEPGRGTSFTIRLPARVQVQPPAAPQNRLSPMVADGSSTVLVIEDDPATRDLLKRFLSKDGFRVKTVAEGEEGLRLARELQPDVITLDVMMSGLVGWAVLTELKADPALADIPVVMLTFVDNKNLGYALGASDYLTKPIQRERRWRFWKSIGVILNLGLVLVVEDDPGTQDSPALAGERRV